jgi:putative SOS response-associated peptidase YedK
MINARAETVATARAYAPSFAKRRCLVPADGWYEWRKLDAKRRQPYFMTPRDGSGLSFAGLWSSWGRGADRMLTYTVITTTAVDEFGLVHDRMPLLMTPDRWQRWLAADPADAKAMLTGADAGWLSGLEIRPVGPGVGDVRNDGPALTARVAAPPLGSMEPDTSDLTLFEA